MINRKGLVLHQVNMIPNNKFGNSPKKIHSLDGMRTHTHLICTIELLLILICTKYFRRKKIEWFKGYLV